MSEKEARASDLLPVWVDPDPRQVVTDPNERECSRATAAVQPAQVSPRISTGHALIAHQKVHARELLKRSCLDRLDE